MTADGAAAFLRVVVDQLRWLSATWKIGGHLRDALVERLAQPQHLGDPTDPGQISPYPCTILEVCQRFATSPDRVSILDGLLKLRALLIGQGLTAATQWLSGSFVEDIESLEARPPHDIDVVTWYIDDAAQTISKTLVYLVSQ
jgi:hypothetical protein